MNVVSRNVIKILLKIDGDRKNVIDDMYEIAFNFKIEIIFLTVKGYFPSVFQVPVRCTSSTRILAHFPVLFALIADLGENPSRPFSAGSRLRRSRKVHSQRPALGRYFSSTF